MERYYQKESLLQTWHFDESCEHLSIGHFFFQLTIIDAL